MGHFVEQLLDRVETAESADLWIKARYVDREWTKLGLVEAIYKRFEELDVYGKVTLKSKL